MSKLNVISPAPKGSWKKDFLGRATQKDASGFPMEGSFGISFGVNFDLSKVTGNLEEEVMNACLAHRDTHGGAADGTRQLIGAFKSLKNGDHIAFKKGTKVIAIVELTSDYSFCPEQDVFWHSWSYRTLKKIPDSEQQTNYALLKTFKANYYVPE